MLRSRFRVRKDMLNMMTQSISIFIFQASFCIFIFKTDVIDKLGEQEEIVVPGIQIAVGRFITGLAMHVMMTDMV